MAVKPLCLSSLISDLHCLVTGAWAPCANTGWDTSSLVLSLFPSILLGLLHHHASPGLCCGNGNTTTFLTYLHGTQGPFLGYFIVVGIFTGFSDCVHIQPLTLRTRGLSFDRSLPFYKSGMVEP